MYDTRPSKHTMELLKSGLVSEGGIETLTEVEKSAESILLGFLSQPGWKFQSDDLRIRVGDFAKAKLKEKLCLDDDQWKEGLTILLKDKVVVLDRSPDRKLHQPQNIVEVQLPSVDDKLPSYLTIRVVESALDTMDRDE